MTACFFIRIRTVVAGLIWTGYDAVMEMQEMTDRDKILYAVRSAARENRLSCEKAHALARELNVSLEEIGKACNEVKIKISNCRLGCF